MHVDVDRGVPSSSHCHHMLTDTVSSRTGTRCQQIYSAAVVGKVEVGRCIPLLTYAATTRQPRRHLLVPCVGPGTSGLAGGKLKPYLASVPSFSGAFRHTKKRNHRTSHQCVTENMVMSPTRARRPMVSSRFRAAGTSRR